MTETVIVVPCFNEAQRFPAASFRKYCEENSWVRFIFINDGSTDDTLACLEKLAAECPHQARIIDQQPNAGKAVAVRAGMREALQSDAAYLGYWDADLATSLDQIPDFLEVLDRNSAAVLVMGSRVKLLGRAIERRMSRHYPGRVFATLASIVLRLGVYDTQCGAKLFRKSDEVARLFTEPFLSSWIFDVEIVARLSQQRRNSSLPDVDHAIVELPLRSWRDIPGSRVSARDFPKAVWELARIYWRYMR